METKTLQFAFGLFLGESRQKGLSLTFQITEGQTAENSENNFNL